MYKLRTSDPYEEQKANAGGLSSIVFLVSSIYLFWYHGDSVSLLAVRSATFVVIGCFAAAIFIGLPFYLLQRGISKVLLRVMANPFSDSAIRGIGLIGKVLMFLQILATFIITQRAFGRIMVGDGI